MEYATQQAAPFHGTVMHRMQNRMQNRLVSRARRVADGSLVAAFAA